MRREKAVAKNERVPVNSFSAMFDGLGEHMATMSRLLAACQDQIKDDAELKERIAVIDALYACADSNDHVAVRFAEMVADRVYEGEAETVLIPHASQSEALAFLIAERGVKQKDLSAIASQSAVSEILNNKRKMTVAQIKEFSEYFSVPVEFFMSGTV